jgi:hypothetical protein
MRIWLFLGEAPFLSAGGKGKEDELGQIGVSRGSNSGKEVLIDLVLG